MLKNVRKLLSGIKLTEEAEEAVLKLLHHIFYTDSIPENFSEEEREDCSGFRRLLHQRSSSRKRLRGTYEKQRNQLIPEAEAFAWIATRKEDLFEGVEFEERWNHYFHASMRKLAFERLGIKPFIRKNNEYSTEEVTGDTS